MRARSQETPSPLLAGNDPASVCASDLSPFSSVFCACVLFGARFDPPPANTAELLEPITQMFITYGVPMGAKVRRLFMDAESRDVGSDALGH